jgi:hypothetical protein
MRGKGKEQRGGGEGRTGRTTEKGRDDDGTGRDTWILWDCVSLRSTEFCFLKVAFKNIIQALEHIHIKDFIGIRSSFILTTCFTKKINMCKFERIKAKQMLEYLLYNRCLGLYCTWSSFARMSF